MRIAHVSDCYAPRVGGIESQVQDLATHQAQRGDAVHVLTATALARDADREGRSRYRASTTNAPGLRVHRLASRTTFGLPFHPLGFVLLKRALAMLKPDVVHVHAGVVSPFAYDGARAARSLGLPLAVTWHCMLDGVEGLVAAGSRMAGWRQTPFAASAVSTVAAVPVQRALERDDVTVLPNGLDSERWQLDGPRPPSRQLRVIATQRLVARKRIGPLIQAIGQADRALGRDADGSPRVVLLVVGEGAQFSKLREQVIREQLGDVVTFAGKLPRASLVEQYRRQDVFAAPAVLEAFGIAVLEARVAGLAVVGRSGSGVEEFVTDGVNGLLTGSDEAMVQAFVRLAEEPDLLARIRATNAAELPPTEWPQVLDRADAVYADAIDRDARSRPAHTY